MDNNDKLRPMYLAKLLYDHTDEDNFLTTAQLIEMLKEQYGINAHRQTIKSDIQFLREFGIEIQEVKSTQNRYNICGRQFDTPELKLLIDAVESTKFITVDKSKQLVDKICSLTSKNIAPSLKRNVTCEDRIKLSNEKVYYIIDAINEAINGNKKIGFQYFKYNEYKEKCLRHNGELYVVTPIKLVWNGDFYYLVGIYGENQQVRNYRVDRIESRPEILDDEGVPVPEDFDLEKYLSTTFRMYGSEYTRVELVCDNDVMDSIIDRFGEEVETSIHNMSSFNAVVDVAVSHVFYSWVFGFGGKVKIKGPKDVREGYEKMVKDAAEGMKSIN